MRTLKIREAEMERQKLLRFIRGDKSSIQNRLRSSQCALPRATEKERDRTKIHFAAVQSYHRSSLRAKQKLDKEEHTLQAHMSAAMTHEAQCWSKETTEFFRTQSVSPLRCLKLSCAVNTQTRAHETE